MAVTDNWMNTVDLGTYKFTLYIVNPDLYNDPQVLALNDTAAINSGQAVIITESGVTTGYTMENVIIRSNIVPGASGGFSQPTEMVFEIYEPLGFSLLDRILSVGSNMGNPVNMPSQNYVLKMEFQGRDRTTGAHKKFPGVFLHKIRWGGIRGSLGPAGAKYFITATFDIKSTQTETVTPVDVVVPAVTSVSTFASNLEAALNNMELRLLSEADRSAGVKPAKEWKIVLDPSTNIQADPTRRIVAFDLASQPWGGTADSSTSSGESANTQNPDSRDITINSETQLTAKINELISANIPTWSTYVNESQNERFYVPSIVVRPSERLLDDIDPTTNQRRKEITATIAVTISLTTPPADAEIHAQLQTNPGLQQQRFATLPIVKKYSYLFSGDNTEILNFELNLENLFRTAISPGVGIYYADNKQQFTPSNPINVTFDQSGRQVLTTDQTRNLGAKFLSDVQVDQININQTAVFERVPASSETQQKNEHTGISDDIAAIIAQQASQREADSLEMNLELKGDPFWLGVPDAVIVGGDSRFIGDFTGTEALIGFVNFQANADDLLIRQMRGPVDLISTGVYRVLQIEHKFQMGQFTQTLSATKDTNTNAFLVLNKLIELRVE